MSAHSESASEASAASDASTVTPRSRSATIEVVLLLVVVGLAVATRLHGLAAESIWLDEATTFNRARLPLAELIANSVSKMHVPTYFLLIHYVLPFGDNEWMLRLPSAVFGVLKVPLVACAGYVLGGARVGLAAALLLVLSPAHLRYDQEARMYAMQTFGTCLALVGQLWLLAHPRPAVHCIVRGTGDQAANDATGALQRARLAWLAWICGVVFALYMHNTSALYLLASSCATLALLIADRELRWRFFWHWTAANLLVLVAWAPWLPSLFSQLNQPRFGRHAWGDVPALPRVWTQVSRLLLGGESAWLNLLVFALLVAGVWQLRKRPVILAALLLLSLSAPLLLWLVSLKKPMFLPRLMLWGGAASYVLAAHGVLALRRGWQLGLAMSLLTVLGLVELQRNYYARPIKTDWRAAAQLLSQYNAPDTVAVGFSVKETRPITYYGERNSDRLPLPLLLKAESLKRGAGLRRLLRGKRHFLFIHGAEWNEADRPNVVADIVAKARLMSRTEAHRVVVERYELAQKRVDDSAGGSQ
jgi:mannosyltransferase